MRRRGSATGGALLHKVPDQLQNLEERIGYSFADRRLLVRALTHRSYSGEQLTAQDNERLEFLGDAVLELLVSEVLMERFPDYAEGRLTKIRATLVSADNLRQEADRLGLGACLLLGRSEECGGGRQKKALLADAVEALIAAVYQDAGLPAARSVVEKIVARPEMVDAADAGLADSNPKSTLQEILHARGLAPPEYSLVEATGPPHNRAFRVSLNIEGRGQTTGRGSSKKQAEQDAASKALKGLASEDSLEDKMAG